MISQVLCNEDFGRKRFITVTRIQTHVLPTGSFLTGHCQPYRDLLLFFITLPLFNASTIGDLAEVIRATISVTSYITQTQCIHKSRWATASVTTLRSLLFANFYHRNAKKSLRKKIQLLLKVIIFVFRSRNRFKWCHPNFWRQKLAIILFFANPFKTTLKYFKWVDKGLTRNKLVTDMAKNFADTKLSSMHCSSRQ